MMKCKNHPSRTATQLCIECGNWYCNQCMVSTSQGLRCKDCAKTIKSNHQDESDSIAKAIVPYSIGFSGLFFIILGIGMTIIFNSLNFLLLAALSIPSIIYFGVKITPRLKSSKKGSKKLTEKQVLSAIKLKDGKITRKQLASLTSVPEDVARDKLNEMTVDLTLRSYVDDNGNIIYTPLQLEE